MIKVEGIRKAFGGVVALRDVSMEVRAGKVHGLLGENGAGKSTLMNMLFGLAKPDAGRILFNGKVVTISSPRVAQRLGIGMVHQHFKLAPALTVLENICLAGQRGVGFIARRSMQRRVEEVAEQLHWKVEADKRVEGLSVGQQQRVEVIKALLGGGQVLILDEPTAVLTPQEVRELGPAVRALAAGGTAVVFISHKLGEVETLCDEVTILRQGEVVHHGAASELSQARMAELMVGETVELPRVKNASAGSGPVVLGVEHVFAGQGRAGLRDVSLEVRAGEIVGIAGVDGNGQEALVEVVVGSRLPEKGKIWFKGQEATEWSIRQRGEAMAYVPGDRHAEGTVLRLSVQQNVMLKDYRGKRFSKLGWLRMGRWREQSAALARQFDVRFGSLQDSLGSLSGGNQQKVVLARELHGDKPLVVAVNPTRGLDVGATAFVMRQLLAARERGAGVLLVHSDLDELLAIADRVLVMANGTLAESGWPKASKERIGWMMMGVEEVVKGGGA